MVNPRAFSTLNNKNGIAMVMVILVMLVMMILITGAVVITVNNNKQTNKTNANNAVYYVAEAGINYQTKSFETFTNDLADTNVEASVFINSVDAWIASSDNHKTVPFDDNNGKTSKSIISAEKITSTDPNNNLYRFTSVGYIGTEQRKLIKEVSIKYVSGDDNGFVVDRAVLTLGTLRVGGADINGPVETYSSAVNAIYYGNGGSSTEAYIPNGANKNTTVYVPDKSNYKSFITKDGFNSILYAAEQPTFPRIIMPSIPTTTTYLPGKVYTSGSSSYAFIDSSTGNMNVTNSISRVWVLQNQTYDMSTLPGTTYYVPIIDISSYDLNFTINVGEKNISLVTNKLILNSPINVVGNGKLTIYVKPNTAATATTTANFQMESSGGNIGNQAHPEKFVVFVGTNYYKLTSKTAAIPLVVSPAGGASYYLSIMAANLEIDLSGGGIIYGYIATNGLRIKVSGGSTAAVVMYFAPNATFTMSGGGAVRGAIISSSFVSEGNAGTTVIYDPSAYNNFPFEILDPVSGGGTTNPTVDIIKGATKEE